VNNNEPLPEITKISFIRKLPNGKWRVLSEKGRNLGTYNSHEAAKERLKQVEMFKHMKKKKASKNIIDLSHLEDVSYSAVMRELRKQCDQKTVHAFLATFKKIFDGLVMDEESDPAEKALPATLILFSKYYPVKMGKEIKND
jgi:hypothetical protein